MRRLDLGSSAGSLELGLISLLLLGNVLLDGLWCAIDDVLGLFETKPVISRTTLMPQSSSHRQS